MIDAADATSTRPYLIRALYEWCTDNGFTPYVAVSVNERVQVPREYVKDGEIVLNISFDATTSLKLGNEFIEFKARFAGTARDIMVPVSQVIAIYARENGQGMAFPLESPPGARLVAASGVGLVSVPDSTSATASELKSVQLTSVESEPHGEESDDEPDPPRPASTLRPALKRVK
jgi:stringent starvation protein B